jgi:hypothetical protein
MNRLRAQLRTPESHLVIHKSEAEVMFAVAKGKISYLALAGGVQSATAAVELTLKVQVPLSKPIS